MRIEQEATRFTQLEGRNGGQDGREVLEPPVVEMTAERLGLYPFTARRPHHALAQQGLAGSLHPTSLAHPRRGPQVDGSGKADLLLYS